MTVKCTLCEEIVMDHRSFCWAENWMFRDFFGHHNLAPWYAEYPFCGENENGCITVIAQLSKDAQEEFLEMEETYYELVGMLTCDYCKHNGPRDCTCRAYDMKEAFEKMFIGRLVMYAKHRMENPANV